MNPILFQAELGPTIDLNLRVSVAVLVRVLFKNEQDGRNMLALERTATILKNKYESRIVVKAKPFGGAVRILKPQELHKSIGGFNYDSKRSLLESDFRILIHPRYWQTVKDICKKHWRDKTERIIDTTPHRELAEEFNDCLGIHMTPDHYQLSRAGMIVQDAAVETTNIHAAGLPTVRIYFIYQAILKEQHIINMIIASNNRHSDSDLRQIAREDADRGGKGRANDILALPFDEIKDFYQSLPQAKHQQVKYTGYQLDSNVRVIID